MADEFKAKGNAAFAAGEFERAIEQFSSAIELAPENHVLYSNRSASYASLQQWQKALEDAEKVVGLNPSWPKGYSRQGAALMGLGKHEDAVAAFRKGLEHDPNNDGLKQGLADAQKELRGRSGNGGGGIGNMFQGPEVWVKLSTDPRTRAYLQQPDFVAMMQNIQKNPSTMNNYLQDPRMLTVLSVLMGVSFSGGPGEEEEDKPSTPAPAEPSKPKSAPEPAPKPEPMEEEMDDEEREKKKRKAEAQREKEEGNAAYKKKLFDEAIGHYSKALELDDEDVTFYTNRAAVYLEMGKYDEAIVDCDKAVERGRELHADYKLVARALTRKGTCLVKMAKTSKDYEPAIEVFQKALTEHRNPDTLKRLNDAEKKRKELIEQELFDPSKADEERELGNDAFKKGDYPEAVKKYTEALKRNPKDAKVFSNRAACYTKLGALPEGLRDAEKCIELDPTFIKGYSRKGTIQFFLKEYDKALETYQEGLKHDENNQELMDGIRRCMEQINKANKGDLSPEELKERQAKAMQDPEIQRILNDPVMRQVLSDMQENPRAAADHLKNPMIQAKIQKLVSAGIVQVR
eukprot:TRINITY_DN5419_c2_g1_i1.p1 TRINITY_DN5419_c2_g1~~TRINITY_DN5419_c2_g1_i1.p1  ORF type:complete len:574 (+),score=174.40 TRINITY_DN5419_c2_g1_i1:258-1979(+)